MIASLPFLSFILILIIITRVPASAPIDNQNDYIRAKDILKIEMPHPHTAELDTNRKEAITKEKFGDMIRQKIGYRANEVA